MVKKSLFSTIFIILIMSFCVIGKAYAVDNTCKLNINSSATEIKRGETLTLNLKVSDINMSDGENMLVGIEGTIDYDTEIFKDVKISSTKLTETTLNENIFIANSSDMVSGVKDGENIITLTLTVKENATIGKTTIKISNVTVANVNAVAVNDLTSSIEVGITESQADNNTDDEKNETTDNEVVNNDVVTNKTTTASSNENKTQKYPYTGINKLIVVAIIIVLISLLIFYIKYKNLYGIK